MSMDKSEIIKMVLELYSARKEAKEYLDFYAEPNEGQKLEEYKHIIREEFYPSRNREPKTRFSVCRKALSDFKKLKPSEDSVAELMVFYMENACQFTYDYGDMWEQFYDSVESWASPCGWGFPDALNDMYEEMKAQNEELRKKYRNFKMPINADY